MLKKTTNVETHRTEGPNVLARPFAWIARWVMVAVVGVGESPCPKWPSARSLGSCQLSALRANGVHYEMDIFIFKKECVLFLYTSTWNELFVISSLFRRSMGFEMKNENEWNGILRETLGQWGVAAVLVVRDERDQHLLANISRLSTPLLLFFFTFSFLESLRFPI